MNRQQKLCYTFIIGRAELPVGRQNQAKVESLRAINQFVFDSNNALWRCPWCNGYRHWKWTRRHEFKSWMRLIAFHIALIPLGKV